MTSKYKTNKCNGGKDKMKDILEEITDKIGPLNSQFRIDSARVLIPLYVERNFIRKVRRRMIWGALTGALIASTIGIGSPYIANLYSDAHKNTHPALSVEQEVPYVGVRYIPELNRTGITYLNGEQERKLEIEK